MTGHSIPHKVPFTQVNISEKGDEFTHSTHTDGQNATMLTPIQQHALALHSRGFNVFPQPYGKKGGYPWSQLRYVRLPLTGHEKSLLTLTGGRCNLAIMCGRTSGNLFVIDCESPHILAFHMQQMRQRHIPIWAVKTARGGHLYLRADGGEVRNIEPGKMQDAEVKGQQGYVLAPPSLHPSGTTYDWIEREGNMPPVVNVEQIDWLTTRDGKPITLEIIPEPDHAVGEKDWHIALVSPYSNLSNATRDYIENGHLIGEGDRNNSLFKAACDLCGNHYTQSDAEKLLLPVARGSGLEDKEIRRTIDSAYSQPRNPSRPVNWTNYSTRAWKYALIYVSNQDWQGRSGNSRRSLMLALIERARVGANSNNTFRASVRELAELARMSTATVQKWLNKLQEEALICKVGTDKTSTANLFRFTDDVLNEGKRLEQTKRTPVTPHWTSYAQTLFNNEAIEWRSVGRSALFLYDFMCTLELPYMPKQLAQMAKLTVNQVNYGLRRLRDYELVKRESDGWQAINIPPESLDTYVDAPNRSDQRSQRFQTERAIAAGRLIWIARERAEGSGFYMPEAYYGDAMPEMLSQADGQTQSLNDHQTEEANAQVDQSLNDRAMPQNNIVVAQLLPESDWQAILIKALHQKFIKSEGIETLLVTHHLQTLRNDDVLMLGLELGGQLCDATYGLTLDYDFMQQHTIEQPAICHTMVQPPSALSLEITLLMALKR